MRPLTRACAAEAKFLLRECPALAGHVGDRWTITAALGYLGAAAQFRSEADTVAPPCWVMPPPLCRPWATGAARNVCAPSQLGDRVVAGAA